MVIVLALGVAGMFVRYGSLKPCEWYVQDLTAKSGMPRAFMNALVSVRNQVEELTTKECFDNWIDLHFGRDS